MTNGLTIWLKDGPNTWFPSVKPSEAGDVHRKVGVFVGTSINGISQKRWLVYKKNNLKWMMTGGTPMTQETPI